MDTLHTPGPWVRRGQTSEDAKFNGTFHRVHGDGAWVSFVPTWDNSAAEASEAEANAHLIAAAPDLYAALQGAIEWMACVEGPLRDGAPFKSNLESYRAALAKARGEA